MNDLKLLTTEEVGDLLNIHKNQVTMYREVGIIKAIKTGKNYMFLPSEIKAFEERFNGYDISNRIKVNDTLNALKIRNMEVMK